MQTIFTSPAIETLEDLKQAVSSAYDAVRSGNKEDQQHPAAVFPFNGPLQLRIIQRELSDGSTVRDFVFGALAEDEAAAIVARNGRFD